MARDPEPSTGNPCAKEAAPARLTALEQALWQAEQRAAAADAVLSRLKAEREGEALASQILAREGQAVREEADRLRLRVEALEKRTAADQATISQLRDRLFACFTRLENLQKERRGLAGLLGRTVQALLGCRSEDRPSRRRLARCAKLLVAAGLFDAAWYRRKYVDVAASGMEPVFHYLRHGAVEGRVPCDPAAASDTANTAG
jgi:hypothetical protein